MYKYHSAGISHTFSLFLTHINIYSHTHTHSERQVYKALVTVAALPMVGLQMRAKARGWGSKFSYTNNACQRGPSEAFFKDGKMLFGGQREGSRPCQRMVKIEMCISRSAGCYCNVGVFFNEFVS